MENFRWCLTIKDGIRLIGPSENLALAYIDKANDSLRTLREISSRQWRITVAYYTMYFSLYSIMMKIGVRCENHACSIEFMKRFLSEFFDEADHELISQARNARVDAQYYINKHVPDEVSDKIIRKASGFVLKCKNVINTITEKQFKDIREKLKR